jgi:hypothetical protein
MSNVPVLQAVRAAESFRRLHWRQVKGALALVFVANMVAVAMSVGENLARELLMQAVMLPCSVVASGALLRLAFADEHPNDPEFTPGPGGLQWGKTEWRLMGVWGVLLFLVVLAVLALAFLSMLLAVAGAAVGIISGPIGAGVEPPQGLVVMGGLLGLVTMLAFIYVGVRLCLSFPATVAEKRVLVAQTWPLTRGQFWPILGAWALINIPLITLVMLLGAVVGALVGAPEPDEASLTQLLAIGLFPSIIASFLLTPLNAGLAAFLYRGLRPPQDPPMVGV